MADFSRTLNFTSANEDGATELEALALAPSDHVLCLTASGARPLDLLLGNPARITAIDINPAQNELLRLKIAAFKALEDEALYAYLGIANSRHRPDLHRRVAAGLPPASRAICTITSSASIGATTVPRSCPCACHSVTSLPFSVARPSRVYTRLSCMIGRASVGT
jgi:S-adenosylmethionine:diacylglycerol 3-amino-3-carboxypropyl transferase